MSSSSHRHEPASAASMWDLHGSSISAWAPMLSNVLTINNTSSYHNHHHQLHLNPNNSNSSNSCCHEEEDVSMGGGPSSARSSFPGILETNEMDTHLWSHMLLSSNNEDELQDLNVGANLLDSISTKSMANRSVEFEPCDYLKKFDINKNSWDTMEDDEKDYLCSNNEKHDQLLSTGLVVRDWSIAPPQEYPKFNTKIEEASASRTGGIKSLFINSSTGEDFAALDHDGDKMMSRYYSRSSSFPSNSCTNISPSRDENNNIADVISFGSRFSKPLLGVDQESRPRIESTINGGKKSSQGFRNSTSSQAKKGRGSGTRNEGKRKRSDQQSCSDQGGLIIIKKQKHEQETSTTSSKVQVQIAKVKLGDRIGNLQQIVSPYGKTDTASVLMEAIQYIKLLQEQVQLLVSNPYVKTNSFNDAWERKEVKFDLTSRGFCLIPVSRAPQVCRENNTVSDYWTPTYRGMFYR